MPSARAKVAAIITGVPPKPQPRSVRAKVAAVLTGVPPQARPHSARGKVAAVIKNPLLDGSHVRDITRMYVAVDGQNTVTVTFVKTLIVNKGNAERRVDTVVTATVENDWGKPAEINLFCNIITAERIGGRTVCPANKSMRTSQAGMDLTILKAYLKTLTDYRDAQDPKENLDISLPTSQAQQQQKDLVKATEMGLVPIALSGVATHSLMKAASRRLVQVRRTARWTATELNELAKRIGKAYPKGKGIKDQDVLSKVNKLGNVLKLPASVEAAQSQLLDDYINPGRKANNICVYSAMKMNGYELYRQDVSPLWAKQGLRALYQFVFFVLDKNPFF